MTAKSKHRSTNEYLKYLKGELSSKERYSFERDLEADPFDMEALEGMEKISAGELEEDLLSLHASLRSRLKRRRRRTYYYVAASVASLLIVGTVFLNIYDINPKTTDESIPTDESFLYEEPARQTTTPRSDLEPAETGVLDLEDDMKRAESDMEELVSDMEELGPDMEVAALPEERALQAADELVKEAAAGKQLVAKEDFISEEEAEAADRIVIDKAMEDDEMIVVEAQPKRSEKKGRAREAVAPVSYAADQVDANAADKADVYAAERIGGIVLSAVDMEPLPGASIVVKGSDSGLVADMNGYFSLVSGQQEEATIIASYVGMETNEFQLARGYENRVLMHPDVTALNEVVVIGYDADKSRYATGAVQRVNLNQEEFTYCGAEPEGGLQAFKRYIEEQIRFPSGDSLSTREIVVLKFQVARDGAISQIQTLRSPGEEFTEEAIRLLKEGPSWNPARNESGITDDVVRMRIIFKK
jgi:hypothetical protein